MRCMRGPALLCAFARCAATTISCLGVVRWMYNYSKTNYRVDYAILYFVILIMWSVTFFFLRFFRLIYERTNPVLARLLNPFFAFTFLALTTVFGLSIAGVLFPNVSICTSYSWVAMSSIGVALSAVFIVASFRVFRILGKAPASGTRTLAAQRKRRKLFYLIVLYSVAIFVEFLWDLASVGVFGPFPGTCRHNVSATADYFEYVIYHVLSILLPVWSTIYQFSSMHTEARESVINEVGPSDEQQSLLRANDPNKPRILRDSLTNVIQIQQRGAVSPFNPSPRLPTPFSP